MVYLDDVGPLSRALDLAALGPWPNCNPRVGCVIVADGQIVGEGYHRGRGTDHAEAMALKAAGSHARGATAYVTLEPCNHHGVTGPCAQALIEAGISRVVFAASDPNPIAGGGAETLRTAGIAVQGGLLAEESASLNREWALTMAEQRPYVVAKIAGTLDGRASAADGTSQWITGASARVDVHLERAKCDAIMVGTGTVLTDDPQLTVRGVSHDWDPTRVVIGEREIPDSARVLAGDAATLCFWTRNVRSVLDSLHSDGFRRCYLEGGPTLLAAFLREDLVDELHVYLAPKLLGAGRHILAELGITTIAEALEYELVEVSQIAADVRLRLFRKKGKPCLPA